MSANRDNQPNPLPRRAIGWSRWFRFGLRSLLVVVAFCAVLAAWWRDRGDLRRRLDQSELLRQSMLPPSDERGDLEQALFQELELSESTENFEVVFFPHTVQVHRPPPGTPNRRWTSETHTVKELQELIIDRTQPPDDRCAAVTSLSARQGKESIPILTSALDFEEPSVQRQAALALAGMGANSPRAVELLQAEMNASRSPLAAYAGRMLWKIEPSLDLVPRFKELLKAEDADARRWAAYALAFSEHPNAGQAMPELTVMLNDLELSARRSAAYAIMNVASKDRALSTLAQVVSDEPAGEARSYLTRTIELIQLGHERQQPAAIMASRRPGALYAPGGIHGPPHVTAPRPPLDYHSGPTPPPPPPRGSQPPPASYYQPGPDPPPPPLPLKE